MNKVLRLLCSEYWYGTWGWGLLGGTEYLFLTKVFSIYVEAF